MSTENTTPPHEAGSAGAGASRPRRGAGPEQAMRFDNRTTAAVIALFAVGYLLLAFQVPEYTAVNVPVQPGTLPRWLGFVLLILAVLLFFQRGSRPTVQQEAGEDAKDSDQVSGQSAEEKRILGTGAATGTAEPLRLGRLKDPRLEIGLFVAALCAYVALFEPLGFVLSTALYLGSMTFYLGYRRHLVTVAVAVLLPLALYLGMSSGLGVILPSGPLPF